MTIPTNLATLLQSLFDAHPNTPIELLYHPDADPGDGGGWAITVGDLTHIGGIEEAIGRHLQEQT